MTSTSSHPNQSISSVFWIGILALLVIGVVRVVVLHLTPMQLFFDEAQYWFWGTTLDFGYFSKPPLLAWIIRAFTEVCGTGEACIRMASPVLYALTALVSGFLAARIAPRLGGSAAAAFLWAVVLFATIPGVSFATRLISTDAPLLLCFATALLFLDRMRERASALNALGLGLAIGAGFMAKYAMVYFVLCAVLWAVFSREGRQTLFQPALLLTLIVAALVVTPNLLWNASNNWITFQHTGENAKWQGLNLKFDNLAEFLGAQIGILGPVLFVTLLIGLWRHGHKLPSPVVFLLCFSLPVILLMAFQATISRAHANWAAVAFVALSVLTVSWAVAWRSKPILIFALLVHGLTFGVFAVADLNADKLVKQNIGAVYKRVFGWREFAESVEDAALKAGAKTVLADRRNTVAQLTYYLRDSGLSIRTWPAEGLPRHFYEMAVPLNAQDVAPVMVVASCGPGRHADTVDVGPVLEISVRKRHSLRAQLFMASNANLLKTDIC